MAAPTTPTLATIAAEALKKAGQFSPAAALTTRAQDLWMEEIKNDIVVFAGGRKLKSLYTNSVTVTVQGKSRYSCPSDYFSDLSLEVLDGSNRGTATGGAAGSITLASSVDCVGSQILVTAGTGVGSMSQCTAFNTSTLVASVNPNFYTAPVNGSSYTVVDKFYPLDEKPIYELRSNEDTQRGVPLYYYPIGDADYGEFELYPVPYNTDGHVFGLRMNYYTNLMTLDLASTLMSTLYQRWRDVWLQGIYAKALDELHDSKAEKEMQRYRFFLQQLIARETYGNDMSNLQIHISDY